MTPSAQSMSPSLRSWKNCLGHTGGKEPIFVINDPFFIIRWITNHDNKYRHPTKNLSSLAKDIVCVITGEWASCPRCHTNPFKPDLFLDLEKPHKFSVQPCGECKRIADLISFFSRKGVRFFIIGDIKNLSILNKDLLENEKGVKKIYWNDIDKESNLGSPSVSQALERFFKCSDELQDPGGEVHLLLTSDYQGQKSDNLYAIAKENGYFFSHKKQVGRTYQGTVSNPVYDRLKPLISIPESEKGNSYSPTLHSSFQIHDKTEPETNSAKKVAFSLKLNRLWIPTLFQESPPPLNSVYIFKKLDPPKPKIDEIASNSGENSFESGYESS